MQNGAKFYFFDTCIHDPNIKVIVMNIVSKIQEHSKKYVQYS